jgi:hypothetical protein
MDVQFTDHGSIWLVQPLTPAGEDWIADNLPEDAQSWSGAVVVEPRYVGDIAQGMTDSGLRLGHG